MKTYHFEVNLQSRELNLVLSKTVMTVKQVPLAKWSFSYKCCADFKALGGNHERSVKNYVAGNIPHRWRFQ